MVRGYFESTEPVSTDLADVGHWLNEGVGWGLNCGSGSGTSPHLMQTLFRDLSNYQGFTVSDPADVCTIAESLARGHPPIFQTGTHMSASGASHWMVATGISRDTIWVNDPGRSAQSNGQTSYQVAELLAAWKTWEPIVLEAWPETCRDRVGLFRPGVAVATTDAFLEAYDRFPNRLGCPADTGGTEFVHDINGVYLQDFLQWIDNLKFPGSDGRTALVYDEDSSLAYVLRTGFWGTYRCLNLHPDQDPNAGMGGTELLGSPKEDEQLQAVDGQPVAREAQRFQKSDGLMWFDPTEQDTSDPANPRAIIHVHSTATVWTPENVARFTKNCGPLVVAHNPSDPSTGPCQNKIQGWYCGKTLTGYHGSTNDRVYCADSRAARVETCANGCKVTPGVNDVCNSGSSQPSLPSAPTGVAVAYDSSNAWNHLTWNVVGAAASYVVYWGTSSAVDTSSNSVTGIQTTDFGHSGVVPGTTYFYRVAAVNSAGAGPLSAVVSVVVPTSPTCPEIADCGTRNCGLDPVCNSKFCGTCGSPPLATCSSDGWTLNGWESTGTCKSNGFCEYSHFTTTCAHGCANGACLGCTRTCSGRACGEDGCGGTCGTCQAGQACSRMGTCQWTSACGGEADGQYCGRDLISNGYQGNAAALVTCRGNTIQAQATCAIGCFSNSTASYCAQCTADQQLGSCDNCGTRVQHCRAGILEGATCAGQGSCAPNTTQACGVDGSQTCTLTCQWGDCACTGSATMNCARCGTQTRTCTAGSWGAYGACTDKGLCDPATLQLCATGGWQTCSSGCAWGTCAVGLQDGPLNVGTPYWITDSPQAGVVGTAALDPSIGAKAAPSFRLDVTTANVGAPYGDQVYQPGLVAQAGHCYTVTFAAKATSSRGLVVNFGKNAAPWNDYGLWRIEPIGTTWAMHTLSFGFVPQGDVGDGRLSFGAGAETGTVWIDDVQFIDAGLCPHASGDLLNDGAFAQNMTYWVKETPSPATATMVPDSSTFGKAAPSIKVTNTSAAGDINASNYDTIQLQQGPFNLIENHCYDLQFSAKADALKRMLVKIYPFNPPWSPDYGTSNRTVTLSTTWTSYDIRFTADRTGSDGKVGFCFGDLGGAEWIDDVSLVDLGVCDDRHAPLLRNGSITLGSATTGASVDWEAEIHPGNGARIVYDANEGNFAPGSMRAENTLAPTGSDVQLEQAPITISQGLCYRLAFWGKATASRSVEFQVMRDGGDWRGYGLPVMGQPPPNANLGTAWQRFERTFRATETATDARLTFVLGWASPTVWIDDVTLAEAEAGACP